MNIYPEQHMPENNLILGITMGDPAGVGPEIAVKALNRTEVYARCRPLIIGDARVIAQAARFVHSDFAIHAVKNVSEARFQLGEIDVLDLQNVDVAKLQIGQISAPAGDAAFTTLVKAIELAKNKEIAAIVTAPLHKESLNLAGHHFAGHTEILAEYTGAENFGLMLAHGNLRVVHVSTHVALREACDMVRKERILEVIRIMNTACKRFGIAQPRVGVAGLNPHASDGGLFGDEEAREISPAVQAARAEGILAEGPIPSDTLFSKAKAGLYDGVVAMYHDQGHIAFKLQTFEFDDQQQISAIRGVNITLGLPIIRTSVAHGTAFDIAGKGIANDETLVEAIDYAIRMAANPGSD